MDTFTDGRDPKSGKLPGNIEERFDSGLDSLKEGDDYTASVECDFGRMNLAHYGQEEFEEPWKRFQTEDGDTYLHLSIIHEAQDIALNIINVSKGGDFLNIQNNQRQTALHLAVITEQPIIVDRLLKSGCDATLVDDRGNTALHIACRTGSMACFGLLTQGCPNQLPAILQIPNYSGQKCIHVVAIQGYLSLLEDLLKLGADIDAQEQCNGRTALHLAVDLQKSDLVRFLISKGADVYSETYGGHLPYHLTYGRPNEDIKNALYQVTSQDRRELPYESDSSDECCEDSETEIYDDIVVAGQ